MRPKEHTHKYFLTAGECNAQRQMPITLIAQRVIEIATEHANILGVGYSDMIKFNSGWVLSRMSIEMTRYPGVNEEYSLTTWIEGFNRLYSERNMEIQDGNGETIGYVRTIWVAIDMDTRRPSDLTGISWLTETINDRPCPIAKQSRLMPVKEDEATLSAQHRFKVSDIDFNRHVNSVRYMDAFLDQWDIEFFDNNDISRFEIQYIYETHFGDKAHIRTKCNENIAETEILVNETANCRAKITFKSKN